MAGYRDPDLQERQKSAFATRKAMLEKFLAKANDPILAQREAERARRSKRRAMPVRRSVKRQGGGTGTACRTRRRSLPKREAEARRHAEEVAALQGQGRSRNHGGASGRAEGGARCALCCAQGRREEEEASRALTPTVFRRFHRIRFDKAHRHWKARRIGGAHPLAKFRGSRVKASGSGLAALVGLRWLWRRFQGNGEIVSAVSILRIEPKRLPVIGDAFFVVAFAHPAHRRS